MHDQAEARAGIAGGPFQHLEIAIGIAERGDRAAANVALNADGFAFLVVVEDQFGRFCGFSRNRSVILH
jgi:hypothetical protein